MNRIDWNDLRYVIAVVEHGSAAAAAKVLNVSHATVLRRIQALEHGIGSPLFERLPTGYAVTDAGKTLTDAGQVIKNVIGDAQRLITGRDSDLSGTVRFTTTDSLALSVIPELLVSFHKLFPNIVVELQITNSILDLDKHDADVTLRVSAQPPETWVGMRLARMDFGAYASIAYMSEHPETPWDELSWIYPDGRLALSPCGVWLRSTISLERAIMKTDSFLALSALAQQGIGAALLPRFIAAAAGNLTLLRAAPRSASADVWVLTHPMLKHSARISVFINHIANGIRALREQFEFNENN